MLSTSVLYLGVFNTDFEATVLALAPVHVSGRTVYQEARLMFDFCECMAIYMTVNNYE